MMNPTVVTVLLSCLCIKLWPTGMTIWALLVALLMGTLLSDILHPGVLTLPTAAVYIVPIGSLPDSYYRLLVTPNLIRDDRSRDKQRGWNEVNTVPSWSLPY